MVAKVLTFGNSRIQKMQRAMMDLFHVLRESEKYV
tara:strand:- start:285 stop:389 length:105 start_codon:yes stop_codon:yes gene_type:complete